MNSLFKNLIPIPQVMQLIEETFAQGFETGVEVVAAEDSVGRILAQPVTAPYNLPGFNRSTVDGYAVKASSTHGASESLPAYLTIKGEVKMGEESRLELENGEAIAIPTGGALPKGADAVVMVEYTTTPIPGELEVVRQVAAGENVIRADEDAVQGENVFSAGTVLRPEHVGVLMGLGITAVKVKEKIQAVVFSTGDEIIAPDQLLTPGKVRDMNGPMLVASLKRDGCNARYGGILPDSLEEVKNALKKALQEAQLVLISGGSSVGQRDVTAAAINAMGPPGVLVHGVGIKPGKPTILGVSQSGHALLGLPGHPVSAQVVYSVIVTKLLHIARSSSTLATQPVVEAIFTRSVKAPSGRTEYIRVKLHHENGQIFAQPVLGESGLLSTLANADGLVKLSSGVRGLDKGQKVEVIPLA